MIESCVRKMIKWIISYDNPISLISVMVWTTRYPWSLLWASIVIGYIREIPQPTCYSWQSFSKLILPIAYKKHKLWLGDIQQKAFHESGVNLLSLQYYPVTFTQQQCNKITQQYTAAHRLGILVKTLEFPYFTWESQFDALSWVPQSHRPRLAFSEHTVGTFHFFFLSLL